jgi:hypothetical protein
VRRIAVSEVIVDESGRLLVRPDLRADEDFALIYRAAMCVDWDAESRCLVTPRPREWSLSDWYRQAVAAVRQEYGQRLVIRRRTTWTNMSSVQQAAIASIAWRDIKRGRSPVQDRRLPG